MVYDHRQQTIWRYEYVELIFAK